MKAICIEKAITVFKNNSKVNTAYLCGSYANGTATERSDIDFAIVPSKPLSLLEEMEIQANLSEELHFENVDLINLYNAPIRLQFNLVSNGKLIFERNREVTDCYIEKLLKLYHDREYRYRVFNADLEKGLKEDYCQ
ncbi:MAG: uncharacterized protein PWP31_2039 [Clostridia bacterium]|jgi:predicted nucleotidyltransferase|nr:uncharacterized protein [Clostridia bacterium]